MNTAHHGQGAHSAGRRRRLLATSVGISALLALGGTVWATGQDTVARAAGERPGQDTVARAASPKPEAAGPAAPAPDKAAATGAPAPVGPASPEARPEPSPVDRQGKSEQQLAETPQPTAAPVDLKDKKAVKGGVSAAITDVQSVRGEAKGIGEIAGPAVRFKVTVTNSTSEPISLDSAVVDVAFGRDDEPAGSLSGPDTAAFPSVVAPGTSGTGVFVFAVPLGARDNVKIHLNLEAETPVATFAGKLPA
ncbi:hypothetical protein ABLI39_06135 [Pseudarthrobacter sp. B907]|uniref:hypothetical protein n=1 Tax=Pseudarthrobacter sp. B907 TaxID=3158261 RepID=UPI0032DAFA4A